MIRGLREGGCVRYHPGMPGTTEADKNSGATIPRVEEHLRIKNDGIQTDEVGLQEDRR